MEDLIHINRPNTSNGKILDQKCPYCNEKQLYEWHEEYYGTTTICQNCKVTWTNDGETHIREPEFTELNKNYELLPLFEVKKIFVHKFKGKNEVHIKYILIKDNYRDVTYHVDMDDRDFKRSIENKYFVEIDGELRINSEYKDMIKTRQLSGYKDKGWSFETGGYFNIG